MHYTERAEYFELAFVLSNTPLNFRTGYYSAVLPYANCKLSILGLFYLTIRVVDPPSLL